MEIKDLIRSRRQELGLTYEELGKLVGVGKSTVRKWETGIIENIRRDNIVSLSKALNIPSYILIGCEDIDRRKEIQFAKTYILTEEEENLIENLRQLNIKGKNNIINYANDLKEIPKYQKEDKLDEL